MVRAVGKISALLPQSSGFDPRLCKDLKVSAKAHPAAHSPRSALLKAFCDGLVSHPGGAKDYYPLNTTEIGDKRRFHGPLGS